jgi:mRNA interferase MazF
MVVCQGEVFWANLHPSKGSEPKYKRPVVIVQRDSINRSKFQTVLVVPLTKQIKHADIPGNVMLQKGDANLPGMSLARCTHITVIDKSRLKDKIGTLPKNKMQDILHHIIWVLGQSKVPDTLYE